MQFSRNRPWLTWVMFPLMMLCLELLPTDASALDLYRIQFGTCDQVSGAIVGYDGTTLRVLTLDSSIRPIDTSAITHITLYQATENPFVRIVPEGEGSGFLKVNSESEREPFLGYAVGFYDDLVMFLDQDGHTRILEWKDIISLLPYDLVRAEAKTSSIAYQPTYLTPTFPKPECKVAEEKGTPLIGRQLITGRLALDTFLERVRKGYQEIDGLRERIFLYYRPIIFDQKNRLGIVSVTSSFNSIYGFGNNSSDTGLPAYFEFGSGKSYRFQNSTTIGLHSWDATPQMRPIVGAQSKFKSHLLHGIIVGNLKGITAGKSLFSERWLISSGRDIQRKKIWATTSFNHETLLGFDYKSMSLSYGYYFPVFAFGQGSEFREIVSPNSSKVWRLAWQEPKWQSELLFFYTSIRSDAKFDPKRYSLQIDTSNAPVLYVSEDFQPLKVNVKALQVRSNTTWQITPNIMTGASLLFGQLRYKETAIQRDVPIDREPTTATGPMVETTISQQQLAASAYIRWDFGRWVAIRLESQFEQLKTKGSWATKNTPESGVTDSLTHYLAGLEFLL